MLLLLRWVVAVDILAIAIFDSSSTGLPLPWLPGLTTRPPPLFTTITLVWFWLDWGWSFLPMLLECFNKCNLSGKGGLGLGLGENLIRLPFRLLPLRMVTRYYLAASRFLFPGSTKLDLTWLDDCNCASGEWDSFAPFLSAIVLFWTTRFGLTEAFGLYFTRVLWIIIFWWWWPVLFWLG